MPTPHDARFGHRTFPYRTRYTDTPIGPIAHFDEGHGPAMIFVHGLGGDFTHFEHIAPAFAGRYRLIGVDMPGCGRSVKPEGRVTLEACARSVLALMTALRIESATLVGHSAGGQIVAEAAAMEPDRVDNLVLINSAGLRPYPQPLHWLARALFRPRLLSAVLAPTAVHILDHVFCESNKYTRKFVVDATQRPKDPLLYEISKVFHDLIPDLMRPTVASNAPRLTMPTLLIWGDRDQLVPIETVMRTARSFVNGQLEIIPRCGHMPIIEHPERTASHMRGFLDAQRSGRAAA